MCCFKGVSVMWVQSGGGSLVLFIGAAGRLGKRELGHARRTVFYNLQNMFVSEFTDFHSPRA
jgi:hypothetical protein